MIKKVFHNKETYISMIKGKNFLLSSQVYLEK